MSDVGVTALANNTTLTELYLVGTCMSASVSCGHGASRAVMPDRRRDCFVHGRDDLQRRGDDGAGQQHHHHHTAPWQYVHEYECVCACVSRHERLCERKVAFIWLIDGVAVL